jgi:nicotinate-nucleotide--dimethylbenzimidazole phosphoribosyltransferase
MNQDSYSPAEHAASPEQRAAGYSDEQRAAVYRVIEERRDVRRGFRPDPVPPEVLTRVIAAAHQAPSRPRCPAPGHWPSTG